MDSIINQIAQWLGVDPSVIIALIPTLVFFFNLAARAIPDDATGALGILRKIVKVLGLYLSNRVTSGVTVNDAAKATAQAFELGMPETRPDAYEEPVPTPSQQERDGRGRFIKKGGS